MTGRIAIIGAGAVGAYVAGYLAREGEDLVVIDPWPEHVERMRGAGLTLRGLTDEERFTTPVRALHLTELQTLVKEPPIDVAFVCVKSYDTQWAATLVRDYLATHGFVVSLQNGMNEECVAGVVGWGRTLGCIAAQISVELTGPGEVRRAVPRGGDAHTVFRVGEVHGRATPRAERVAGLVANVDSAKVTTNLWGERWSKLVANAMANAVSAATGMTSNECARDAGVRGLLIRTGAEAVAVGEANGFALEPIGGFAPHQWVAAAGGDAGARGAIEQRLLAATERRSEDMRPSMGQDVLKGRRTEIDHLNGVVVAKGREAGVDTPVNTGLVAAVRRVERGEAAPGRANVEGLLA